ncbi:MAG: hypothetical protein Q7U24_05965, partial [Sulfurimicrobium sp.]|nr:hypothetical protein [Sulfurimicrobium sp.]
MAIPRHFMHAITSVENDIIASFCPRHGVNNGSVKETNTLNRHQRKIEARDCDGVIPSGNMQDEAAIDGFARDIGQGDAGAEFNRIDIFGPEAEVTHDIMAIAPVESIHIATIAADQHVLASAAHQEVASCAAGQLIVAIPALQSIFSVAAVDQIIARAAEQDVIAFGAIDDVVAFLRCEVVVPGRSLQGVIPGRCNQQAGRNVCRLPCRSIREPNFGKIQ